MVAMCRSTSKFPLSVRTTLLTAVFLIQFAESARNGLRLASNVSGAACPGDVLMYVCDIIGSGNTIWNGTAFYCPSKSNETILRHSQFSTESGTFGSCNDRTSIMVQSLGVINNCFSSQLNITVTTDMNNATIRCSHSSNRIETVGEITLSVATVPYPPPLNVQLIEVRTGELTFSWAEDVDHPTGLYYATGINSTCGTCHNTTTTMATCFNLNLSTTPSVCAFTVQSVACDTTGSPSRPVMVTLAVPGAPNATIIPQYSSLSNDEQLLTEIVVCVKQKFNVTSFSINGAIPGSTTSYRITLSSGSSILQSLITDVDDTCEYTVKIPSSNCSISGNVDVTIVAANRLGFGPPSEPTTIGCNNQFVKVNYDHTTTTISCTFENKLYMSPKSCSVKYGTCDEETKFTQNSTTDESLSIVILKLNLSTSATNSKICYAVTASNGTFTAVVKGNFKAQSSDDSRSGVIIGPVVTIGLIAVTVIVISIVVLVAYHINTRRKGHAPKPPPVAVTNPLKEFEELTVQHALTQIRSVHFEMSRREDIDDCKLSKYVFVEHTSHSSEKILDVVLRKQNGDLFSCSTARNFTMDQLQEHNDDKVFILPINPHGENLKRSEFVLHQRKDQLQSKFQVLCVKWRHRNKGISMFLNDCHGIKFECKEIFYQFPKAGIELLHYRDIIKLSKEELQTLSPEKELKLRSGIGIHMFYDLKSSCVPGEKVKPPDDGYFIQCTPGESDYCLQAGSVILVYKGKLDIDDHRM